MGQRLKHLRAPSGRVLRASFLLPVTAPHFLSPCISGGRRPSLLPHCSWVLSTAPVGLEPGAVGTGVQRGDSGLLMPPFRPPANTHMSGVWAFLQTQERNQNHHTKDHPLAKAHTLPAYLEKQNVFLPYLTFSYDLCFLVPAPSVIWGCLGHCPSIPWALASLASTYT